MKLKAYLQLQKSETLLQYPTDSLSNIETLSLLGTDIITTGTGTTGDTTILTSGINTTAGITMDNGITTIIGGTIIMCLVIGHMLDRRLNRNLDQDLDQDLINQENQENQDQ